MADVLSLGGVVFQDYSPPESMMLGGREALVIHKLPGGSRVIGEFGPDEADIGWKGFFLVRPARSTPETRAPITTWRSGRSLSCRGRSTISGAPRPH